MMAYWFYTCPMASCRLPKERDADRVGLRVVVIIALAIGLASLSAPVDASIKRSQSAKVEFKHQSPCPATGASKGPCKGYVIDHIEPLACGGADNPSNMQWQTVAEGKAKDKWERKSCGK